MKYFSGKRWSKSLRAALVLLTGAVALTACGSSSSGSTAVAAGPPVMTSESSWNTIVDKAKEEGSVTVYWSMPTPDKMISDFEAKYGVKVNIVFAPTGDLVSRLDQELSAQVQGADIVIHASPGWFSDKDKEGVLAALQVSPENQADGWEKQLNGKSYATWWGFPYVLGYQKALTAPTDLKSLLDSNPNAKIGLVDPHVAQAIANTYEQLRQTYGDGILDQLAAAQYTVFPNNSVMSQSFAAGAVDYAYPDQANTTGALIAKGAPLAQVVPDKGLAGPQYNVATLTNSPHPNAAAVFANYVMSKNGGQAAMVELNKPAVTVPANLEGAIPWGNVATLVPDEWTTDKWNAWMAQYWTPRFK